MSEETLRLVTIGRIIRRRGRLLTVLALVGALAGYGASLLFPPRYTTSASVLLPGAWQERELLTQAEIATSSVVVDRAAAALGWPGVGGGALRDRVSAETTDGNIIRISGTSDTPERAQQLSDQMVRQFVAFAARIAGEDAGPEASAGPEELRRLVVRTNRRITELADSAGDGASVESVQARTELAKLRTALQDAVRKVEQADSTADRAHMVVMGPAARPTGEAPPTRAQLVAGGALLFFLLGVVGHLAAARAGGRPRTEREVAAALGATAMGTVGVPVERAARRSGGSGAGSRLRRLLGLDVRWDAPAPRTFDDEAGLRTRYRRVCARLHGRAHGARRLLVVVPEGDELARRAAGRLAAEAGGDRSPSPSGADGPVLRVVGVGVSQPVVPDREADEAGALVVLSAGDRTAAELTGLAEACADAGHEVVGVVLAEPVLATRQARPAGRPGAEAPPALAVGETARGGVG
ncbi:polysaccharide biosynthesis protein [Streptomyces durbertensis]|uniref:Polysaccharide biosynthesis protein n=1 Tax=Streptomyces durbertensis TaxID=2448886 RepID=A0ABR6EBX7_9ACTN|nr:polysaccharide biosynthesis protein [Streptomyces durbertensis]MBB1242830.1 polysaccharide biosynthesis protein [Streptomyces durbertensis]